MSKTKILLLLTAVTTATALGFVNCSSQFESAADFSSQSGLMHSSKTPLLPAPSLSQPVGTFCSNSATAAMGGTNIMAASQINALFIDSMGNTVCSITDQPIRADLINEQTVQITNIQSECPSLTTGTYKLSLVAPNSTSDLLWGQDVADVYNDRTNYYAGTITPLEVAVIMDSGGNMIVTPAPVPGGLPTVLLNSNISNGAGVTVNPQPTGTCPVSAESAKDAENPTCQPPPPATCDASASPLLVQIIPGTSAPQTFQLSPPLSGILFDILGQNSSPRPHTKKLISWFTPSTVNGNYFLVLPNTHGQVLGIDQMFGNNTQGPDGAFAVNGYEALRKWDGRMSNGSYNPGARDGVIDRSDAIFAQLRLWEDVNGDGIAQASELHTLDDLGIISISLGYNSSFQETDTYGNQIRYKSAVSTKDGLSHVMYDIWFRLIDP